MRSNVYCGNLLWQLSLTLFFPLAIELAKGLSMVCRADGSPAKGAATLTVSVIGGEDGDVLFTDSRRVKVV